MQKLHIPHIRLLQCEYTDLFAQSNRWNFSNVSAPYWRLYWTNRSSAAIRNQGRRIELGPGRIVLVPPNSVFSTFNKSRVRQLFIHFEISAPYHAPSAGIVSFPLSKSIKAIIRDIIRLKESPSKDLHRLALTAHALTALVLSNVIDRVMRIPDIDPRILKSLAYIDGNLGSALTNNELARSAGLSTNAFITLFKAQVGHTPHIYLRMKRIDQACLLLHFSDNSIKQIAAQTRFCDRYHFSRVFKHIQRIGPAEYRRLNMNPFTSHSATRANHAG